MLRCPYRWLLIAILLCGPVVSAADTGPDSEFLAPDKAFSYQKHVSPDGQVTLNWSVAPGYYLYRSRLKIKGEPAPVESVQMPHGTLIHDQYFGDQQVFKHDVTVTVAPGNARKLKLSWQGCAKAGLCYPPQHATLDVGEHESAPPTDNTDLSTALAAQSEPSAADTESAEPPADSDQGLAARLAGGATGWTLLAFFGMGLLLSFTPCVLPMVPILSGVVVGTGARGLRGLTLSLAFVLPMALTYAVLGVGAALAGANLQAMLQTPAVLGAFAGVFLILSLAMFGVFELQLPAALRDRLQQASANRRGGHLAGAAAMGVISAVLVGPCMTAPLAGALLYIAQSGDVVLGGLALLSLGLGMGVPLLAVGTVGAQLLPRPGPWMTAVKVVFGFLLLATALWMIQWITPAPLLLGLWGAWLLAIGVTLWQTARLALAGNQARSITLSVAGGLLSLWGLMMVVGAAGGAHDPLQPLAFAKGSANGAAAANGDSAAAFNAKFQIIHDSDALKQAVAKAQAKGQWTVVDFYADWCVSCHAIDRRVFGNAKVQSALAGAQLLRPDVTDDSPEARQLMGELGVVGPPTILFIGPDGQERRAARVVGELSASDFLQHLSRAKGSS